MNGVQLGRFLANIEPGPNGCWRWSGYVYSATGYGAMSTNNKRTLAHRLAYEHWNGPIPDGLQIDHLCRNRWCVNPAHLEAVTQRENLLRGETIVAREAAQTHCIHGHEFTPENTLIRSSGKRTCRTCKREGDRRRYQADPVAGAARRARYGYGTREQGSKSVTLRRAETAAVA